MAEDSGQNQPLPLENGGMTAGSGALNPSLFGRAMFTLFPLRRRIVMENLRRVFGDHMGESDLRSLAQSFYSHIAKTFGENLSMLVRSSRSISDKVDVIGVEHMLKAEEQGHGVLILTGHFGNWELAAVGTMLQFGQYRERFHVIRKSLFPGVEHIVFSRFRQAGLQIISAADALTGVFEALEKKDVVIFIMDQYQVVGSKGIMVEFFGKAAGTNRSLALVARQSGAPVIPASSFRQADGRHVMQFHPPLEWIDDENSREELHLNTLGYNRVLEKFVLDHPDQWLWMHRRWKDGIRSPTNRRRRELRMGRR